MSCRAVLLVMIGAASTAHASIIEFRFVGQLDTLGGSVAAPVSLGQTFDLRYRFDSHAEDSDPSATAGSYIGAMIDPSLKIEHWTAPLVPSGDFTIVNGGPGADSYNATAFTGDVWISADLNQGSPFSSDALPRNLDLSDWSFRSVAIEIVTDSGYWNAAGTITTFERHVIPAPAGFVSFGGGIMFVRRRRNA